MTKALVLLAEGSEELEAVTVIDLLRRAGVEVLTAGLAPGPIRASRGVVLLPDTTLDQVLDRDFDVVVLPGGQPGTNHLDADARVHRLLVRMASAGRVVAAICAAPKVLANAGLLAGKRATAYPGALESVGMTSTGRAIEVDSKLVTSRGPGTAMDFALQLIEMQLGAGKRAEVEAGLVR